MCVSSLGVFFSTVNKLCKVIQVCKNYLKYSDTVCNKKTEPRSGESGHDCVWPVNPSEDVKNNKKSGPFKSAVNWQK